MLKLKTDADIAIYLRNVALTLEKLAEEKDIRINIFVTPDGYAAVDFDDYGYRNFRNKEGIEYRPWDNLEAWGEVRPDQIQLGKTPGGTECLHLQK